MIVKSLTEIRTVNKKSDNYCDQGDLLFIKKDGPVLIVFGKGGYFPVRNDKIEYIDMTTENLIKTIEDTEKNFADLKRKNVFPVEFVTSIVDKNNLREDFILKIKRSKISDLLKKRLINEV